MNNNDYTKKSVCHIATVHPSNDIRITVKEIKSLSTTYNVTLLTNDSKSKRYTYLDYIYLNKKYSRKDRIMKSRKDIKKLLADGIFDIYHIHEPELLPLIPYLKKKGGLVIYDSHEDTPKQIQSKSYLPKILRLILSKCYQSYERRILKSVDGVIAATPIIREKLLKVNKNTIDIKNYPILKEFDEINLNIDNKYNQIIYIGGLSKERGLNDMLAIAKLTEEYNFVFCGSFVSENDRNYFQKHKTKNCIYKGQLDREGVLFELGKSKIGLVLLEDNERFKDSLPIKLFEYMAAGLAIIASNFDEWEKILDNDRLGFRVNPSKHEDISNRIKEYMNNDKKLSLIQKKSREKVFKKYNWENESEKLNKFYKDILRRKYK